MTHSPIYDPNTPIVCTLNHHDLDERFQLLDTMRSALTVVERSPHGLILRFPPDPKIAADVRRFAADEKQCCRFWGFDVTATATHTTLRWDGPPDSSAILDDIQRYLEGDESVDAFAGLL